MAEFLANVVADMILWFIATLMFLLLWNVVGLHDTFHLGTATFGQALSATLILSLCTPVKASTLRD